MSGWWLRPLFVVSSYQYFVIFVQFVSYSVNEMHVLITVSSLTRGGFDGWHKACEFVMHIGLAALLPPPLPKGRSHIMVNFDSRLNYVFSLFFSNSVSVTVYIKHTGEIVEHARFATIISSQNGDNGSVRPQSAGVNIFWWYICLLVVCQHHIPVVPFTVAWRSLCLEVHVALPLVCGGKRETFEAEELGS